MKGFNPNEDRKFTFDDLHNGHIKTTKLMEEQMSIMSSNVKRDLPVSDEEIDRIYDYLEGKVVSGMELSDALEISELLLILNKLKSTNSHPSDVSDEDIEKRELLSQFYVFLVGQGKFIETNPFDSYKDVDKFLKTI